MKRNIILYTIAAALLASSCGKDLTQADNGGVPEQKTLTILAGERPATHSTGGTRVSIAGDQSVWSVGDSLGVFTASATAPVRFRLSSGAGTVRGNFGGEIEAEPGERLYVLYPYLPEEIETIPTAATISFNGQTQDGFGADSEAHLGRYAFMASEPVTLTDGKGSLKLHNLAVKMSFEFSLPEPATVRFLTMSTAAEKLYDKGVVDLTADTPAAVPWGTPSRSLSMGFKNASVAAGQTVTAHMMMLPTDLSATPVTFYVSAEKADGTPVTYTMTKSAGLDFGASYSYVAEVTSLGEYDTFVPMVYVPGGSLTICALAVDGMTDDQIYAADYKVNSFWMSRTEVTNQQYCDFLNDRKPNDAQLSAWVASYWGMVDTESLQIEKIGSTWKPKTGPILNADGTTSQGSYGDYPMIYVTYLGANAYGRWLAETKCGYPDPGSNAMGFYLPSEAQWEYAATGSEWNPRWLEEIWAGADAPDEVMWSNLNCDSAGSSCLGSYIGNGDDPNTVSPTGSKTGGTHPVAVLKPNFLGLYDMSGNASEICRDWFCLNSFPYGNDRLDPWCSNESAADKFQGESCRSCRGGLWGSFTTVGLTYYRDFVTPVYYSYALGFRVILPLK